jgi:hypothetical protein
MNTQVDDVQNPEFAGLPYPLTAPEGGDIALEAELAEDTSAVMARLIDDLSDVIMTWKSAVRSERAKLATGQLIHDMPMEYRAGLAQGLEQAAQDLETVLGKIGR